VLFKTFAVGELTSPRVDQYVTWLTASWLSTNWPVTVHSAYINKQNNKPNQTIL